MSTDLPQPSSLWLELAGCSHEIRFVEAGGVRTRCLIAGKEGAPSLVFLHGSGGYLESFVRNIAAHAVHFRVVALDMIGHGYSDKPDHYYEPHHYVDHLLAVFDELDLGVVSLSGDSLGAWVAARMASQYPNRVDRIVLNTAAGVDYDPEASARIRSLSLEAARNPTASVVRARLEWLVHDPTLITEEMVALRCGIYGQPDWLRATENIMCLHTEKHRVPNLLTEAECASISAPTLVIWTDHSPNALDLGRKLAGMIEGSRFVAMEGCGHWPQYEKAEQFNAVHLDFLLGGRSQ